MLDSNLIEQLYVQIKNNNNDTINWKPVLEVLFKEKEKICLNLEMS